MPSKSSASPRKMKKHDFTQSHDTDYGFDWGGVGVSRAFHTDGRGCCIGVRSFKDEIQVYVSPTGKIRVFNNHKEIK